LGRKQNQSDTPLEIDIQDFLRPLTAIHLPSTENATEPKNWREENQRTFDRRVKRSRQRYMHFCETALAYCVAVSIMMENQIENPGQDSGRLMDALSFADELIDEIKKHEFIKMDKTLVPEADRRVVYMWSVAATAFFDLMGIRFAIANGHTDWQSVTETAKLELPLSKKWLAKGFAGDSLDDFKDQTRRLLAVLLYKNVRLVRLSEPDIDDAASLETAPS
jgi:hypothetical protein